MKKILSKHKYSFLFFVIWGLFLFNTSCGLDNFEYIEPPVSVTHSPSPSNTDPAENYVEFYTNEPANSSYYSQLNFLGTKVYYNIYKSDITSFDQTYCKTQVDELKNLVNEETNSNSYSTMINKGFKELYLQGQTEGLLIPRVYSPQKVVIRLTNYTSDVDVARVSVNEDSVGDTAARIGIPVRMVDDKTSFDFFRSGDNNSIPLNDDPDVNTRDSSALDGSTNYYIPLFACGVAFDTTVYSEQYSNILYLGTIKVTKGSENN